MNMKYIYIISILVIVTIGLGCVGKTQPSTTIPIQTSAAPKVTDVPKVTSTSEEITPTSTSELNKSTSELTDNTSDTSALTDNTSTSEITGPNATTPEVNDTATPEVTGPNDTATPEVTGPNDTAAPPEATEIFKIGDEKNMLGANIKLVNITDYDNNTITLLINGAEYTYTPETTVKANNIEIIDVITSLDDKTAEITVEQSP